MTVMRGQRTEDRGQKLVPEGLGPGTGRHLAPSVRAFTLIELLVVVAIIMILMGLLFPAYNMARGMAKKTKARAEVKQLDMAWKSMLSDYRTWALSPTGGEKNGAMDSTMVGYLSGVNSKGIVYMDFDGASLNGDGAMVDPWYKAGDVKYGNSIYWVALGDYAVTPYAGVTLSRSVAAWSKGPDGNAAAPADYIQSWNISKK